METLVLTTASVLSFGALPLQARSRAFYVIFLHMLLLLTVGSFTYRTLSGDGTLLIPFVDGWPRSPLMHLTNIRAYSMLAISLLITLVVCIAKVRILLAQSPPPVASWSLANSAYGCLMMIWIHLLAVLVLVLF